MAHLKVSGVFEFNVIHRGAPHHHSPMKPCINALRICSTNCCLEYSTDHLEAWLAQVWLQGLNEAS